MLAEAGEGLLDMHRSQRVHLDVKPMNVLVHCDEQVGRPVGVVRGGSGEGREGRISGQEQHSGLPGALTSPFMPILAPCLVARPPAQIADLGLA